MTDLQFHRWKDFALRMARTCYRLSRRPSCAWITESVEAFFAMIDEEGIPTIRSWDSPGPYPEGSRYYKMTRHACWCRNGIGSVSDSPCRSCGGTGYRVEYAHGPYICDLVSEMLDEQSPAAPVCRVCENRRFGRWNTDGCRCDEIEWLFREQWSEQWGGPVRCCIRAGLDMAAEPSGGVLGFTAGDVRAMYPEGVPEWMFDGAMDVVEVSAVVPGIGFVPRKTSRMIQFDALPDTASIWL